MLKLPSKTLYLEWRAVGRRIWGRRDRRYSIQPTLHHSRRLSSIHRMGWPFGSMTMVWMHFTAGWNRRIPLVGNGGRCIEWAGKRRSIHGHCARTRDVGGKSALDRFARYKVLNRSLTILFAGQSCMLQLDCRMPSDRPIRCCSSETNSLQLSLSVSNCRFLGC